MNTDPPGNTQESVSEPVTKPLKSRVLGGGLWLLIGNGVERGLRFARMAVLARLLAPEDFGLMGLILVATGFVEALTFTATNQAIIQHPSGRSREFLNTVFTVTIVRGLILAVIIIVTAPWIAAFFDEPKLTPMIRVVSLTLVVMGLMNPAVQVILKDLDFRRWAIYQVVSGTLSVSVTIILGLWLRNVWALVIGLIGEQMFLVCLSYLFARHRPSVRWDRSSALVLARFCRKAFAIPLIIGLMMQAPNLLLGKLADTAILGAFLLTLTLADIPTHIVTRVVATVGLPAFSSISDDLEGLFQAWQKVVTRALIVFLLAMPLVLIGARPLLMLAYGPAYAAQAPVLRVLCIYVMMRMLFMTTGPLMWAVGRPDANRAAYLVGLVVTYVSGAFLVKESGAVGMALALGAGWGSGAAVEITLCLRYFAHGRRRSDERIQSPRVGRGDRPAVRDAPSGVSSHE